MHFRTRWLTAATAGWLVAGLLGCESNGGPEDVPAPDVTRPDSGAKDTSVPEDVPFVLPDYGRTDIVADGLADTCLDCADAADFGPYDMGPIEPGMPGAPCQDNDECNSGFCIESPDGRVCARLCQSGASCPDGTRCLQVQGEPDTIYGCVYVFPRLCLPCSNDAACKTPLATGFPACIGNDDGWYCGTPCQADTECPASHECREVTSIEGVPTRQCAPRDDECGCSRKAVEESMRTPCAVTNAFGRCTGERYCTGSGLTACSAKTPAAEVCDGTDNDCNGFTDDAESVPCLVTNAYGSCPGVSTCALGKEVCQGTPASQETCNGTDDDCDGLTDEQDAVGCTYYYRDQDEDGLGKAGDRRCLCSPLAPYTALTGTDCDDNDKDIGPGSPEVCNGRDDNCDGFTDEEGAEGCLIFYRDEDEDQYGVTADSKCLCSGKAPYTAVQGGDCNDQDRWVKPSAVEQCSGKDDNCDGVTDPEGAAGCKTYYYDGDQDGYGTAAMPSRCLCGPDHTSRHTALQAGDCDDTNNQVNPGRAEVCGDGIDNNCNDQIDEDNGQGCVLRFEDKDGDGFGMGDGLCTCGPRPPYTALVGGDCNDLNRNVHPNATESCGDGIDNNCNGSTDEEGAKGCVNRFHDFDGDGYGTGTARCLCADEGYYTAPAGGDCDDDDPLRHPGQTEACGDGIDNNCNGQTDEEGAAGCQTRYADRDFDSFGNPADAKCLCGPTGVYTALNNLDCDDGNGAINPLATEACGDGKDNNCNGLTDEENANGCVAHYYDGDGDTFGDSTRPTRCLCGPDAPSKYTATRGGDCNDASAAIHPDALELCEADGVTPIDNNCNGLLNEENAVGCKTYYYDGDGDGRGTSAQPPKCFCTGGNAALKYTSLFNDDCNDADAAIAPHLTEVCDGKDNNCNGQTDEANAQGCRTYYKDQDQDGFGTPDDWRCLCAADAINRYTATEAGDCNDNDGSIYPGASVCGKDGDCDGNLLDPGEACDDGNAISWDGCTNCQVTEFRVNVLVDQDQWMPAVAALADGGYAVAYQSMRGTPAEEIGLRLVNAEGRPLGTADIWVNSFTAGAQRYPAIAPLPSGGFVVVWDSMGQDSGGYAVIGQRMTAAGAKVGGEILINVVTQYDQRLPVVGTFGDGGFVVAWQSFLQDGDQDAIIARRMNSDGTPNGGEFVVNQTTAGNQDHVSIATMSDGRFIVAWRSEVNRGGGVIDYDVFIRRYAANGTALAGEELVNTTTAKNQSRPWITMLGTDGFVVVWESQDQDGSGSGIYGQRFTVDGTRVGSEFRVNTTAFSDQAQPRVTGLADGRFVVLWRSNGQDGSGQGVYAQRYAANGTASGLEFRLHQYTAGDQWFGAIAAHSAHFLAAWASANQDGSAHGVYARRFDW